MIKLLNILICPLDWGLGHATRCIPIIKYITTKGCKVFIAAEGNIKILLENEFPDAVFLPLNGYNINYSKQKKWLPVKIASQIPQIIFSIFKEHKWVNNAIKVHSINAVISDNRFGLYTNKVPCIYITHQLFIKAGNSYLEKIISNFHYFFINKFTQCWVPDFEGEENIAGQLSHPVKLPKKVLYIGCLSRFHLIENTIVKYDLLILLSGPEPQRTILEDILLKQVQNFKGKILFVRGLPGSNPRISSIEFLNSGLAGNIEIKNHLSATKLNIALQQAEMILCRSGFTTVMDLIMLHKKAILIPTPGQTEQEYLGKYLMKRKLFYTVKQSKFSLSNALENASYFNFSFKHHEMNKYKNIVDKFLETL